MTSIKDVAREVACRPRPSPAQLRGLPRVSDETRTGAQGAAELDYVASPTRPAWPAGRPARSAWWSDRDPLVLRGVVQGAEELLREAGYDLLLYNLGGDREGPARCSAPPAAQAGRRCARAEPHADRRGVAALDKLDRPVAVVGATVPGWSSVRIDDMATARIAMRHLLEPRPPADRLHRRVARGAAGLRGAAGPAQGYRSAMATAGCSGRPVVGGRRRLHRPRRAGRHAPAAGGRRAPDAGLRASDEMAVGAGTPCARPACGPRRTSRSSASTTTTWPSSSGSARWRSRCTSRAGSPPAAARRDRRDGDRVRQKALTVPTRPRRPSDGSAGGGLVTG